MKHRKRWIAFLIVAIFALSGCTGEGEKQEGKMPETPGDGAGNAVTIEETNLPEVLAEHSLTMLNVWATFCDPCIDEMPDLGELASEYAGRDFQIVGVVIDIIDSRGKASENQIVLAKKIISQTQADYRHLLPTDESWNDILRNISAVPTTIFLDSEGNQVGQIVLGSRSKTDWIKQIDARLEEISNE